MTNKAERLHSLILTLKSQLSEVSLSGGKNPQGEPLWMSFEPLAQLLGMESYGDLRDNFLALCDAVEYEIATINLSRETVRFSWQERVLKIRSVFDATNLARPAGAVFDKCFSEKELNALDMIAERFATDGVAESKEDELRAALDKVRGYCEAIEELEQVSPKLLRIVKLHLRQIEEAFGRYNDFGDDLFWKNYKDAFSTFVQLHNQVAELNESEEVKRNLDGVLNSLASKTVVGLSLGGNLASIASFGVQLIAN